MREAIFILAVLIVLFAFTAYRYRRQIATMLNLWRMMKSMRQMNNQNADELPRSKAKADGPLVRCSKCGIWSPQGRSIKLAGNTFYCSSTCVEKAVV